MLHLTPIDLGKNELRNAVAHLLAGDPGSPVEGQWWYNTIEHQWKIRLNGSTLGLNDALLAKAATASPTFTGTVTVPTPAQGDNSTKAASTAYVVTEIAARLAAGDFAHFSGLIDASASPNYPAGNAGDVYRISVAGKIGGASGAVVENGDLLFCLVDGTAAGTQATVGANWAIAQTNIDGAVTLTGTQTLTNKTLTAPVINNPTGITSTSITEGSNLYFTDERAQDALALAFAAGTHSGLSIVYDDVNNKFTFTVTASGTVGKYSALIGDASATSFTITQATHGRASNSQNMVSITDATTGEVVYADITIAPATGNVTIAFAAAPAANAYRVTILG